MLSFATIRKLNGMEWRKDHLLSLAGVYQPREKIEESAVPLALTKYLSDHPEIKLIVLRLDNDRAGLMAAKALTAVLPKDYTVTTSLPSRGKDYNDCLCMHLGIPVTRSKEKTKNDDMEDDNMKEFEVTLTAVSKRHSSSGPIPMRMPFCWRRPFWRIATC